MENNKMNGSIPDLQQQIRDVENHLATLKANLAKVQAESTEHHGVAGVSHRWPLTSAEYARYGRQMIVPSVGIQGQLRLHNASVLIIGAGGLGCPAAVYLAGAGVKRLGIVDGDTVELSNLHRQILHNTATIDKYKIDSAIEYLQRFNPETQYTGYPEHLTPLNACEIVSQYDLVLDCTDHPKSRYLISDACVLLGKPLVSASALKTDGQLMVLNSPAKPAGDSTGGPCYRCVFPKPPLAEYVTSCGDGGILGPVVGVMGVLQALEAIKLIIAGIGGDLGASAGDLVGSAITPPSLLIFSSMSTSPFRSVRLRGRRTDCFACSSKASLTMDSLLSGSLDYVAFCGDVAPVTILRPDERISAQDLSRLSGQIGKGNVLIDVREKVQFDICHIDGSINLPFSQVQSGEFAALEDLPPSSDGATTYVICRFGNDSQLATRKLSQRFTATRFKDIEGGLRAWRAQVDKDWPDY